MAEDPASRILIEWPDMSGTELASIQERLDEFTAQSERAVKVAMQTMRDMAELLTRTIEAVDEAVCPDEMKVEFGLRLDAETGALLAKTSAGAHLCVTYKWVLKSRET
jgi:hypothetical protein